MAAFDVSMARVVYSAAAGSYCRQLWVASLDRSHPARRIGDSSQTRPHFGPRGQILFQAREGNFNYLEQMNPDGSGRSKVVPYPIITLQGVSPGRRWVMAVIPILEGVGGGPTAVPVDGGTPRAICANYCIPAGRQTEGFSSSPSKSRP